ncbi:MAG: restriction endonuclease [Rhodobacteraceae bacterium]|nr:restriction endonuclease [Paracoccaceae bacterium]
MRLWLVRLGKNGEGEKSAQDESLLSIDFGIREDITGQGDRDAILSTLTKIHPDAKPNTLKNYAAQINQFVNMAETGDLVISPMKTTSTIWIGRLSGPYKLGPENRVTRPVEWLKTDVPRDAFRQDLLYSFGAFMTVCEISRNEALARVQAVIKNGSDPGDGTAIKLPKGAMPKTDAEDTQEASDQPINLDTAARDQIERRIASTFTGHDFTRLVAAVLNAQGYRTRVSPPGADSGVDIVAGSGPLGLESPRLVVQVKSGSIVLDQPSLQGLIGSVQDTQADHGLIVSWGGFTAPVRRRLNELYFRVRLWGRDDLVDNLLNVYEALPEDIRADLPLRRVWTLVMDEDEALG